MSNENVITNRLPTPEDCDLNSYGHKVWVWRNSGWYLRDYDTVREGEPWTALVEPPAYIPPKPKRGRCYFGDRDYLEILPGDPDNFDAFLEAFDVWYAVIEERQSYPDWGWGPLARVMIEARKPKELCPHGNPLHDCNACDRDSDSVNDRGREE